MAYACVLPMQCVASFPAASAYIQPSLGSPRAPVTSQFPPGMTAGLFPVRTSNCSIRRKSAAVPPVAQLGSESVDSGSVIVVEDSETMEKYIREAGAKLVVVDVSTTTCGPCRLIYPKFVKMSVEYPDVLFLKINGDLSNDTRVLMRKWGVKSVPNFRFFRNGELVQSHVGAKEDELRAHFLSQYVQSLAVETP